MKKKTIFALTIAFVMGALAVTPLFAQNKKAEEAKSADSLAIQPLGGLASFIKPQMSEAFVKDRERKMVNSLILLINLYEANLTPEQKELISSVLLSSIQSAELMKTPNNLMQASWFVSGYENSKDKDAYVTKVFSKLVYKGSGEYIGSFQEIVKAIKEQDIQAFRDKYESYIVRRDKLLVMETVFSVFEFKETKTNVNTGNADVK